MNSVTLENDLVFNATSKSESFQCFGSRDDMITAISTKR